MSSHPHLPPTYFDDVRPLLPSQVRSTLLAFHSASTCGECGVILDAWLNSRVVQPEPEARLLRGILSTSPDADDLAAVRREATKLSRLSDLKLRTTLQRAVSRYRSPALVGTLLAQSRAHLDTSAEEAARVATVAALAAQHMARPDLRALALAYIGNAHRADGWLDQADTFFRRAYDQLALSSSPNPWLAAELNSLHASLLKDHRRLAPALTKLFAALPTFAEVNDRMGSIEVLLVQASVHRLAGEPDSAIVAIRATLETLDPLADLTLFLRLLHNLALYLSEAGQPSTARALLDLLAPLYERFPSTQVRRSWLAGVVARKLNEVGRAETYLRAALGGFLESGHAFFGSFVALDLAELLLAEGRTAEVEAVTRHLPALFDQLDVRPEATAAVLLFHKAAARNELNRQLLVQLREFLERARVDRGARFSPAPL